MSSTAAALDQQRAEGGGRGLLSFNEESFDSFSTPLVGRVGAKGRGGGRDVDAELLDLAADTPLVDRVGAKSQMSLGGRAGSEVRVGGPVGVECSRRKEKEKRAVGMERGREDDDDVSLDAEDDLEVGHEAVEGGDVDMLGGVVSDSSFALRIESGIADLDCVRL